uniref:Uncharacterized protein n=1 Tax=Nomascus leucogenys TaxID=61853 RepID=A0A2I3GC46_NOMLE
VERSFVWLSCLDSDSCNLTFRLREVEKYLLPGAGSCHLIGGRMPEN